VIIFIHPFYKGWEKSTHMVELHLEDQWHNRTVGARARCPHTSFQRRLGILYIGLEYLLM
jgi:hypothetical protein